MASPALSLLPWGGPGSYEGLLPPASSVTDFMHLLRGALVGEGQPRTQQPPRLLQEGPAGATPDWQ